MCGKTGRKPRVSAGAAESRYWPLSQAAVGNDSVSLVEEATCSEACVYCYGDNCDIGEKLSVGLFKSAFLSQIAQP